MLPDRHAHAAAGGGDGDGRGAFTRLAGQVADAAVDRLQCFPVGSRQDHQEFVAAQAAEGVALAQALLDPGGHFLEHLVAGGVAQGVVDQLEAVQIDHDAAQLPVDAALGLQFPFQERQDGAAVEQRGQRVIGGQVFQLGGALAHLLFQFAVASAQQQGAPAVDADDAAASRMSMAPRRNHSVIQNGGRTWMGRVTVSPQTPDSLTGFSSSFRSPAGRLV